jgi:hypothetical protein
MDIYFWLALFFQVGLIILFVMAWRKTPRDKENEDSGP